MSRKDAGLVGKLQDLLQGVPLFLGRGAGEVVPCAPHLAAEQDIAGDQAAFALLAQLARAHRLALDQPVVRTAADDGVDGRLALAGAAAPGKRRRSLEGL